MTADAPGILDRSAARAAAANAARRPPRRPPWRIPTRLRSRTPTARSATASSWRAWCAPPRACTRRACAAAIASASACRRARASSTSRSSAAMAAGAAYVPVDADDPEERARLVFGEAGVRGVITGRGAFEPMRGDVEPDASPEALFDGDAAAPQHARDPGRDAAGPRRRRVDHLHLGIDRHAEGRRGDASIGGRLRRRRGGAVPAGRAARARGPRAGRPLGGLRRILRGDVAGLAARRVPRARTAQPRAQRHGPRSLDGHARHLRRLDRARRSPRCGRPRRSRTCGS